MLLYTTVVGTYCTVYAVRLQSCYCVEGKEECEDATAERKLEYERLPEGTTGVRDREAWQGQTDRQHC